MRMDDMNGHNTSLSYTSNPALSDEGAGVLPDGVWPISNEELRKCAGCTGQWDNYDTGCFCRYGQKPGKCEGPKE